MRGDQLSRQWKLIQRLAKSRYGCAVDDLASELDCVRRTVYRDLDALMYAGFPITSEKRDGRVFYRLLDGFQLGDTPFTADEVLALAFGEDLLRILEGTVFHDSIQSALAKIRASLGPELGQFVDRPGETFRVRPGPHKRYEHVHEVIRVLNEAVLEQRTISMAYTTARTGEVHERALDPYRIWYRNGGLYVIGHDHRSNEIRTFAVDRVRDPSLTDDRFTVRDDFDFDSHFASSFGVVAEAAEPVQVRFDKRWALYVQEHSWHPSQRTETLPDGSLDLFLEVGAGDELRNWILSFGAGAWVVAPERLRSEVAAELARAAERYAP